MSKVVCVCVCVCVSVSLNEPWKAAFGCRDPVQARAESSDLQKVSFVQTPNPKVLLKSIWWTLSCFNGKSMLAKNAISHCNNTCNVS